MKNKIYGLLRGCAFWGVTTALAASILWLWMLLLGTWSLAEGGQDSCAKMAEFVLKSCGNLFYK